MANTYSVNICPLPNKIYLAKHSQKTHKKFGKPYYEVEAPLGLHFPTLLSAQVLYGPGTS